MKSDKELRLIAEEWLEGLVDTWFWDYSSWDGLVEDGELTEEELEYIQNKIRFTHQSHTK